MPWFALCPAAAMYSQHMENEQRIRNTYGATSVIRKRGILSPDRPLTVIMYGFLTRSTTWMNAFTTVTHRATCKATPRQLSRRPCGCCQRRLQSQMSVPVMAAGQLCRKKSTNPTREMGVSAANESSGAKKRRRVVRDHDVYQVWTNKNWMAWRSEYWRISRGVKEKRTWIIEYAQANCWAQ